MPQQSVTPSRSSARPAAMAPHSNHVRTHHTTPSRSRGTGVPATLTARWRNPGLARAAMFDSAGV